MAHMNAAALVHEAGDALKRGDWRGARSGFEKALELEESAAALEGLGTACWWLDEQAAVFDARERAFRLYRAAGDFRSAARLASLIAIDYAEYRGDLAVSSGWLDRAEHLLEGKAPVAEHGWIELWHGYLALRLENDLTAARRRLATATELARKLGVVDIEMMAVALGGMILIREGRVPEGMRRIDEAMAAAVGGEMSDLAAIGITCCSLIYACEAVADYDRAAQWCERTRELSRRLKMDPFFTICRIHYATVLIWRGSWDEAAEELNAAVRELPETRPYYIAASLAKLGELRRRQGRLEEAAELFQRASVHRNSFLGRAALALDQGDHEMARHLIEHILRRFEDEEKADYVLALDVLVRAHIQGGETDEAAARLAEMEAVARTAGTRPLRALTVAASGALAVARGDLTGARVCFEDAIGILETAEAEFDTARIRLEYAHVLDQLGRRPLAVEQAMLAQAAFVRVGAALYADRAIMLVGRLGGELGPPPTGPALPHGLTAREVEVLWLIAKGKTNQEIASELVLSVRTVERHISTIYEKLQLHGRAARASAAALAAGLGANT
jgi:ATP/maltotriose-dependent transcriptional regulator MalT